MSKKSQNPTKTEKVNNLERILRQIKKAKKKENIEYIVKNILTKHVGIKYVKILENNNIGTHIIPRTIKTLRITPMSKHQSKYIYFQNHNILLSKPRHYNLARVT